MTFNEFKIKHSYKPDEKKYNFKSYVYEVTSKIDNKKYIGFRTSKQSNLIDDFWSYGTSGCRKEDILSNPQNYNVKILKEFNDRNEALYYESYLHEKYNVSLNPEYFNICNSLCKDGYSDTSGTTSVVIKENGKRTRIPLSEYYDNMHLYETAVSKMVTVRYKGERKYFNVTQEEFQNNRDLYYTTTEGYYFIEVNGEYKKIKDYDYNPDIHKIISKDARSVLCRKRNTDRCFTKIPKDLYNNDDYETPSEVLKRPENKGKIGCESLDGRYLYINPEEWCREKFKPFRLSSQKRADEFGNIKDITKQKYKNLYKLVPVFDKVNKIYKTIRKNKINNNYELINEKLLTCIYNNKKIRIPQSEYKRLKDVGENIIVKYARPNRVPVFDNQTNTTKSITKEEFYNNKDRYIALSSRKIRDLKKN